MRPLLMLFLILLCLSNQSCNAPLQPALNQRLTPQPAPFRITGIRNSSPRQRAVAVKAGQRLLRSKLYAGGLNFEPDPVGFVRAAWWEAGIDLFSQKDFGESELHGLAILYRSAITRRALFQNHPRPGDLIFLGHPKSAEHPFPSQVALVEYVLDDGTVYALGRFAEGPGRIQMNLKNQRGNSEALVATTNKTGPQRAPLSQLFWSYARPY